jgi:xanthine dehydrogenase accessory factor
MSEVLQRAVRLGELGESFALATVVAVDRPVSARVGDRAIVSPAGSVDGWVGGSCSEPIVVREALAALADGTSRLVRIRPPSAPREPSRPGVVTEITTCASEGGVDVFIEPRLARPRLVLVGSSPVTRALHRLAVILDYRVDSVVDDLSERATDDDAAVGIATIEGLGLRPEDAIVVATMNRYDEMALEAALRSEAGYIGLVASRERGKDVFDMLATRGVAGDVLARVRTPAGLDLGPSTQEEIALAIMAEMVAERHRHAERVGRGEVCVERVVEEAIDPVCGMAVAIVDSAIGATYEGRAFYFCGQGCRDAFLANPESFLKVG